MYDTVEKINAYRRLWSAHNPEKIKAYQSKRNTRRKLETKLLRLLLRSLGYVRVNTLSGSALAKKKQSESLWEEIQRTGKKTCKICEENLPVEKFYVSSVKGNVTYYLSACISCHLKRTSQWSKDNPEQRSAISQRSKSKKHYQAKNYGKTPEQYEEMREKQKDLCAICERPEWKNKRLAIDHDHKTKKVRELLCDRCNTSIGKFEDSPALLRKAADYIEKHSQIQELETLLGQEV